MKIILALVVFTSIVLADAPKVYHMPGFSTGPNVRAVKSTKVNGNCVAKVVGSNEVLTDEQKDLLTASGNEWCEKNNCATCVPYQVQ